jgi:hypothetical protein
VNRYISAGTCVGVLFRQSFCNMKLKLFQFVDALVPMQMLGFSSVLSISYFPTLPRACGLYKQPIATTARQPKKGRSTSTLCTCTSPHAAVPGSGWKVKEYRIGCCACLEEPLCGGLTWLSLVFPPGSAPGTVCTEYVARMLPT